MIDWFVLLGPLLFLPIISLFAFAGCQLFFPVFTPGQVLFTLKYPANLKTDVDSVVVDFSFTTQTFSGEEKLVVPNSKIDSNGGEILGSMTILHDEDLEGGWAEGDKVKTTPTIEDEAQLTCKCVITFTNSANETEKQTVGPVTQTKQAGNKPDPFKLLRTDDLFSLEHS
jgi:hypothetical protein